MHTLAKPVCACYDYSLFTQLAPQGRPSRFSSHRKGAGLPHPKESLFTQPASQGRPSRFSSYRKGADLPHPIRGAGSGLQS